MGLLYDLAERLGDLLRALSETLGVSLSDLEEDLRALKEIERTAFFPGKRFLRAVESLKVSLATLRDCLEGAGDPRHEILQPLSRIREAVEEAVRSALVESKTRTSLITALALLLTSLSLISLHVSVHHIEVANPALVLVGVLSLSALTLLAVHLRLLISSLILVALAIPPLLLSVAVVATLGLRVSGPLHYALLGASLVAFTSSLKFLVEIVNDYRRLIVSVIQVFDGMTKLMQALKELKDRLTPPPPIKFRDELSKLYYEEVNELIKYLEDVKKLG